MENRRNLQFIAVKTYYQPKELVEILGIAEKEIVRFAYCVGAMYEVVGIRLIYLPILMDSLKKYRSLMEDTTGIYMELGDAEKKTGLSAEVVTRISSSASALYQIGMIKIIDVKKLEEYIRGFQVTFDFEDTEPKKLRGSKFVREILRDQQGVR